LDALELVVNTHLDASYSASFREDVQGVKSGITVPCVLHEEQLLKLLAFSLDFVSCVHPEIELSLK